MTTTGSANHRPANRAPRYPAATYLRADGMRARLIDLVLPCNPDARGLKRARVIGYPDLLCCEERNSHDE